MLTPGVQLRNALEGAIGFVMGVLVTKQGKSSDIVIGLEQKMCFILLGPVFGPACYYA